MIVIFDLDGTVWDSEPGIVASLEHAFEALGLQVPADDVLASQIGPPLRQMLAALGVEGPDLDRAVAAYRSRYATHGVFQATLYPGITEVLDRLDADGHRMATATSKGHDPTLVMLDHFAIRDRFQVVGAATMDGLATTKSAVLAGTLHDLGAPAATECVMIGDRHYDVTGSAAHRIDCIGVTWGYGDAAELIDAGAWALAHSPAEVLSLLAQR